MVFEEMQRPGTPMYNIKAYLPVIESFGFTATLRAATGGQAFPQCGVVHWEQMTPDPLQSGSQTNTIVLDIRRRKGLKPGEAPGVLWRAGAVAGRRAPPGRDAMRCCPPMLWLTTCVAHYCCD